jgi:hypothetical protein
MTGVIGTPPTSTPTAEPTLRRPAVVAGVGILLISILAGLANFGAVEGLVTGDDATTTAHDILASEETFRLVVAAFVVVAVLDAVVAWALYAFFTPVNRELALLAGWLRLAYAAVFTVAISLKLLGILVAVAGAGYLVDSFGALLFSGHALSVAAVTFVGEFLLMLWLLVKGRNFPSATS